MIWRQEISHLWTLKKFLCAFSWFLCALPRPMLSPNFCFLFISISNIQNKRKSSWISTSINLYLCKQQICVKFKVNIENWQFFVLYCWPLLKAFLSAFRFSFRFFTQNFVHNTANIVLWRGFWNLCEYKLRKMVRKTCWGRPFKKITTGYDHP